MPRFLRNEIEARFLVCDVKEFVRYGVSIKNSETEALDKLRGDLSPHADQMRSAERLREGRSIGSGPVEGVCKNLIGRRLKANTACSDQWAPTGNPHENHTTELRSSTRVVHPIRIGCIRSLASP